MPNIAALRITTASRELSPDHKRFNSLLRQLERLRSKLAAWRDHEPRFRQSYACSILPLVDQLMAARRQWVVGLDAVLRKPGWTRAQRQTLRELAREGAAELLASSAPEDEELKNIFERSGDTTFAEEDQQNRELMVELTEMMTGLDLGDRAALKSDEDVFARLHAQLEAQEAEPTARRARKQSRAKREAAKRHEAEAQLAAQSVRELYRKLASSLHPDRESDPLRREEKTSLMQRINRAYAANDLLTLLEVQLQIEHIDAAHAARASIELIRRYNNVLAQQVSELKNELEMVAERFSIEFGIESQVHPHMLGALLEQLIRELRADIAEQARQARLLSDPNALKRWLKRERERRNDWLEDFPF